MEELVALQARLELAMEAQGLWPADSPWVRPAMQRYPRHLFAPDRVWVWTGDAYVPLDREADEAGWAKQVYGTPGDPTITQVDPVAGVPTSSLSCEEVVADMLDSLSLAPQQRTLELGAATGRNARLLATRTGPGLVTTVELDPAQAATAARNLADTGGDVEVIQGDGALGAPDRGRFLRVISTYAVDEVPWTWVAQTEPGGRIVAPWGRLGHVALTVAPDGQSARGWMQGLATFMPARGINQGLSWDQVHDAQPCASEGPFERTLGLLRRDVNLLFALRVIAPDIRVRIAGDEDHARAWLHDGAASWALVTCTNGRATAQQGGPRCLATELTSAWREWEAAGAPGLYDFGMTRTPDQQYVWARDPENGPRW